MNKVNRKKNSDLDRVIKRIKNKSISSYEFSKLMDSIGDHVDFVAPGGKIEEYERSDKILNNFIRHECIESLKNFQINETLTIKDQLSLILNLQMNYISKNVIKRSLFEFETYKLRQLIISGFAAIALILGVLAIFSSC